MTSEQTPRLTSGVGGLDQILEGGLLAGRSYLVRGEPGAGKTILGMHYLSAAAPDESALFVNLEESTTAIRENAASLGIDLSDVAFLDLSPSSSAFVDNQSYDIFPTDEVEREPFIEQVVDTVERVDPDRVFVDPVTQLRYLSPDEHQFRKQVIGFTRYLTNRGATVMFTSQDTEAAPDDDLQFLSDGTIQLGHSRMGHTVSVEKFRGSSIQTGEHSVHITESGMQIFPELLPKTHGQGFVNEAISSGVPELDNLLGGGIERGTTSVISGPTGVGKTTLGTQFVKEAAVRDERAVVYLFEENRATFETRSNAIDIPITKLAQGDSLTVREMEPLNLSPPEFAHEVRQEVESNGTELVMIDGIDGYKLAIQGGDDLLVRKLHALARYLKNMGVTTILIDELSNVTGEFTATNAGISYVADNVVFLRHIEHQGELRKVIGVLKKRTSDFEHTLRELEITDEGIVVGGPLDGLQGILTGAPTWDPSMKAPGDR